MILSVHCNAQIFITYINKFNNHKMEKLNINEIKSIKEKMLLKKGKKEKKIFDKNIKVLLTDDGSINYSEKLKDGTLISLSGNEYNGYIKKEIREGSPIETHKEYFTKGGLKKTGEIYKEIKGVDRSA